MKNAFSIVAICASLILPAEAQTYVPPNLMASTNPAAAYQLVSIGGNENIWQKTVSVTNGTGKVVQLIKKYNEVATGLNHLENGQWVASKENIDILQDGTAAATNGQHQAYFPADIYEGVIKLVMPDGRALQSRPIGLSYADGSNFVMIAEVTNSIGQLMADNQAIYTNAFIGINADVLYIYKKSGFEQDVILRQKPPTPESLGLNPGTTKLQVLTEFFDPPQPHINTNTLSVSGGLPFVDEALDFGAMKMAPGKTFLTGENLTTNITRVGKRWINLDGRTILVEEVPVEFLSDSLSSLPLTAKRKTNSNKYLLCKKLKLPLQRFSAVSQKNSSMQIAKIANSLPGLVLDYNAIVTTVGSFTFRADTTYYIPDYNWFVGPTTIEGGVVIKYAPITLTNYSTMVLNGPLNCQTSPYRPAILTSMNDDSVGEIIPGSTGDPRVVNPEYGGDTTAALWYNAQYFDQDFELWQIHSGRELNAHDLQFRYMAVGMRIQIWGDHCFTNEVINCQFNHVIRPFMQYADVTNYSNIRNVLVNDSTVAFQAYHYQQLSVEQATVHRTYSVFWNGDATAALFMTNSLLIGATNIESSFSYNCATNLNDAGIFQVVGAGSHYLATNSSYRGIGTTNINSKLLMGLREQTTYPPIFYSNTVFATPTVFVPQVQTDTNSNPDLGYHYYPVDYVVSGCSVSNAILTVTNGAIVASYGQYGLQLMNTGQLVSVGSPLAPNLFVRSASFQENAYQGTNGIIADASGTARAVFQFTKFTCPAASGSDLYDGVGSLFANLDVENCEFYGGANDFSGSTNTTKAVIKNNLFWRSSLNASNAFANASLFMTNNTFWGTAITLQMPASGLWSAFNNIFDSCTIGGVLTNGYNAYLNTSGRLTPNNSHDFVSANSPAYQLGPLGGFYLSATNYSLVNAGNTNANLLGLYQFTTQTNQTKDANTRVDIGYHYAALDTNGYPMASSGDGISDYMEDPGGVSNWVSALSIVTQPANQWAYLGDDVFFTVATSGFPFPTYQWYYNGSAIAGGTNATLELDNVHTSNMGNFYVTVSNPFGTLASQTATLNVLTNFAGYIYLDGSVTNFIFQGDTTYYINSTVQLYGTTTIEGGTVIKYGNHAASKLVLNGPLNCLTAPYRPAILTSKDDVAAGAYIHTFSALPTNTVCTYLVDGGGQTNEYKGLHIFYAGTGILGYNSMSIWDCQFVRCGTAIANAAQTITFTNTGDVNIEGIALFPFVGSELLLYQGYDGSDSSGLLPHSARTYQLNPKFAADVHIVDFVGVDNDHEEVLNFSNFLDGNNYVFEYAGIETGGDNSVSFPNGNALIQTADDFGTNFARRSIALHNVLISQVTNCVSTAGSVTAEFLTADQNLTFCPITYAGANLTNCILTAVANTNGVNLVASLSLTNGSAVYQVTGGGSYYLAPNTYQVSGTSNLNDRIVADIANKTTHAPVIYNVTGVYFSTNLNLFPQAQRDNNNSPDLGYHYDPLDYIVGSMYVTNATITLNPGTAIGIYSTNGYGYGLAMADDATLICAGAPDKLVHIAQYLAVQERMTSGWLQPWYGLIAHFNGNNTYVNFNFTDCSVLAQDVPHIQLSGVGPFNFQNCQFHGGQIYSPNPTFNFTNCLFERVYCDIEMGDNLVSVFRNNLVFGGTFGYYTGDITNAVIKDNLFDQSVIYNWIGDYSGNYNGGHNAYVTNCDTLHPTFSSDVILAHPPIYQTGPLGNYYQPSNSPLINMGSTNANLIGFYHFTTQANQVKEASSIVDIGYHYVAVDANGIPMDTDGNGVPDYLQDANGNGTVDSGETNWALSILTQPLSQTLVLGQNTLLSVGAMGVNPINYQWYINGVALTDGTNSTLMLCNIQTNNTGTYFVVVSNAFGVMISSNATLIALNPPTITIQPTNCFTAIGSTGIFGVSANGSAPMNYQWYMSSLGLLAGATNSTLFITNAQPGHQGVYFVTISNSAGSIVSSNVSLRLTNSIYDLDYDGQNDSQEIKGGTDMFDPNSVTNVRLGYFSFDATNTWVGSSGQTPLSASNVFGVSSWSTNAILIDNTNGAILCYRDIETNGNANINLRCGSVRLWFKPDWSSLDLGGTGPNTFGRLLEIGTYNPVYQTNNDNTYFTNGWWSLYFDPDGTEVYFGSSTNGGGGINLTATISCQSNIWHEIVLTYTPTNSILYFDGQLFSTGKGSINYPNLAERGGGFRIGSDGSRQQQAQGTFDELETFNYPLDPQQVWVHYTNACAKAGMAPVIVSQPADQTVGVGDGAIFSVTVAGAFPLSYQWQSNGVAIAGATNSTFIRTNAQPADNGKTYRVVVQNPAGNVTSTQAVMSVWGSAAAAGIVSWWQAESNALDSLGSNHGMPTNGVISYDIGEAGSAFLFDGNGGYVEVPASSSLDVGSGVGFTLEGWIKPADLTNELPLLEWQDGAHFWISALGGAGCLFANIVDTNNTSHWFYSSPGILTSNYQHVALTYDSASGQAFIYRNGIIVASNNVGTITPQTTGNLHLGARLSSGSLQANYKGDMDEMSIYSRALSADEVATIYNDGCLGKRPIAPAIINQPANQAVSVGANATFSVTASGTSPLNYQWQSNGIAISGATGRAYTKSSAQTNDDGTTYNVVVKNAAGGVTSITAILSVSGAPVITQPPANASAVQGWSVNFAVHATGAGLTYQWKLNGATLTGKTASTLSLSSVSSSDAGKYSVVVANASGTATAEASLIVLSRPTITGSAMQFSLSGTSPDQPNEIYFSPDLTQSHWYLYYRCSPGQTSITAPAPNSSLFTYGFFVAGSGKDSDGDGLSDGSEPFVSHTSGTAKDSDGDGMPDGWETAWGTNPNANDAGSYLQAYKSGTDPFGTARPTVTVASVNGSFVISRTGSISGPLTVYYTVGGTAVYGSDYTINSAPMSYPFSAIIQTGQSSVTLTPSANPVGKTILIGLLPYKILSSAAPSAWAYVVAQPSAYGDSDGDGLADVMESIFNCNPLIFEDLNTDNIPDWREDTDQDGLPDAYERLVGRTWNSAEAAPLLPAYSKDPLP